MFRVGCYFTNGQGGLRSDNLGSVRAEPFDHRVSLLSQDDVTLDEIQCRSETKRRLGEVLVKVFVRLGRRPCNADRAPRADPHRTVPSGDARLTHQSGLSIDDL